MSNREPIATVITNLADDTVHNLYYPLSDAESSSVQLIISDGTAADDITVHAYLSNDPAADASADWTPADDIVFGTMANNTGITNSAAAINSFHILDTLVIAEKMKITYQRTNGAGGTSDITIRVKRS